MDDRTRRVGENEALYREVNERVADLNDQFEITDELIQFVCECGDGDCIERIALSRSEYEHVRADGRRFALRHGHDMPDVERVVEEHERYVVVEKDEGPPADLAEAHDPR